MIEDDAEMESLSQPGTPRRQPSLDEGSDVVGSESLEEFKDALDTLPDTPASSAFQTPSGVDATPQTVPRTPGISGKGAWGFFEMFLRSIIHTNNHT